MAEAAHLGADGIRFNDGLFNTDNRYFREVSSGALSRMVAGPSVKIELDTGADQVYWVYQVGTYTHNPFSRTPAVNAVTEFAL